MNKTKLSFKNYKNDESILITNKMSRIGNEDIISFDINEYYDDMNDFIFENKIDVKKTYDASYADGILQIKFTDHLMLNCIYEPGEEWNNISSYQVYEKPKEFSNVMFNHNPLANSHPLGIKNDNSLSKGK